MGIVREVWTATVRVVAHIKVPDVGYNRVVSWMDSTVSKWMDEISPFECDVEDYGVKIVDGITTMCLILESRVSGDSYINMTEEAYHQAMWIMSDIPNFDGEVMCMDWKYENPELARVCN